MYEYLKKHEKHIIELLAENDKDELKKTKEYFKDRILFLQHERLIHLIVTISFSFFLLTSLIISVIYPKIELYILDIVLIIFMIFYIIHYYRLENGVQKWYDLYDKLDDKINKCN